MKILPLSFLGRLRGGANGFGFCSFVDKDGSSSLCSLFSSGSFCAESLLGPAAVCSEGPVGLEERLCDCGLARTDSAKL